LLLEETLLLELEELLPLLLLEEELLSELELRELELYE
jgi:hypothetical protein